MKQKTVLSVIGGDDRQFYISELLQSKGYEVKTYGIEGHSEGACETLDLALDSANIAVLPLPVTRDGYRINAQADIPFDKFAEKLPPFCRVFAGSLSPAFKDCLEAGGYEYFDYYEDPFFVWNNADISAEGAIYYLMSLLDVTVKGARVLVCGYGRIGKSLSSRLVALGARVTVAARKENDLMQARLAGCKTERIDYSKDNIINISKRYDAVLNTIPNWIFNENNCNFLKGTVYIELASAPYGGRGELLKEICRYKLASGIPGKYAPKTAADAVLKTLIKYIES